MAIIGNLLVRLRADSRGFEKGLGRARKKLTFFQRQAKAFSGSLMKMAGIGAGFYGLQRGIRAVISAALKQEEADKRLAAALEGVGVKVKEALPQLKKYASRLQEITVYGDEVIEDVMSRLVNIGGLTGESLRRATKATIGLATKLRVDLQTAALLVARAAKGQTQTLSRYGIVLGQTLSKQEQFNQLLQQGAKAFRLAEREAETTSGTWDQLANSIGDLAEAVGKLLLAVGAKKGIRTATEAAKALTNIAQGKGFAPQTIRKGFVGVSAGQRFVKDILAPIMAPGFKIAAKLGYEAGSEKTFYKAISEKVRGRIPHPAVPTGPINPYEAHELWLTNRAVRQAAEFSNLSIPRGSILEAGQRQDTGPAILDELRKIRMALVE